MYATESIEYFTVYVKCPTAFSRGYSILISIFPASLGRKPRMLLRSMILTSLTCGVESTRWRASCTLMPAMRRARSSALIPARTVRSSRSSPSAPLDAMVRPQLKQPQDVFARKQQGRDGAAQRQRHLIGFLADRRLDLDLGRRGHGERLHLPPPIVAVRHDDHAELFFERVFRLRERLRHMRIAHHFSQTIGAARKREGNDGVHAGLPRRRHRADHK